MWRKFWDSDNTVIEALQTVVFTLFLVLVVGVPWMLLNMVLDPH